MLVPLDPVFRAWSMRCPDSDIGDTPAFARVIPLGRFSFLLHPCLQLDTAHRLIDEANREHQLELPSLAEDCFKEEVGRENFFSSLLL